MNKLLGLKVKIKTLSDEAKNIRHEENKQRWWYKASKTRELITDKERSEILDTRLWLYDHRIKVLRPAARSTHLAYAFLRGRAPSEVESSLTTKLINWREVERMVKEYGDFDGFEGWKNEMDSRVVSNHFNVHEIEEAKAAKRRKKREAKATA